MTDTETKLSALTQDELLLISANTEFELRSFIYSKKYDTYKCAKVARLILTDIGRDTNMLQHLIMMQTLKQVRTETLKDNPTGILKE